MNRLRNIHASEFFVRADRGKIGSTSYKKAGFANLLQGLLAAPAESFVSFASALLIGLWVVPAVVID